MAHLYWPGRPYLDVYADMVATILTWVRRDLDICAVSYGHPGVLDQSSREAVRRAGAEGYETRFLPGISTLDCLFADLELDPGVEGCQMFDATDFLVNGRRPDVAVPLILFQISLIGVTHATSEVNRNGLRILAERDLALLRCGARGRHLRSDAVPCWPRRGRTRPGEPSCRGWRDGHVQPLRSARGECVSGSRDGETPRLVFLMVGRSNGLSHPL